MHKEAISFLFISAKKVHNFLSFTRSLIHSANSFIRKSCREFKMKMMSILQHITRSLPLCVCVVWIAFGYNLIIFLFHSIRLFGSVICVDDTFEQYFCLMIVMVLLLVLGTAVAIMLTIQKRIFSCAAEHLVCKCIDWLWYDTSIRKQQQKLNKDNKMKIVQQIISHATMPLAWLKNVHRLPEAINSCYVTNFWLRREQNFPRSDFVWKLNWQQQWAYLFRMVDICGTSRNLCGRMTEFFQLNEFQFRKTTIFRVTLSWKVSEHAKI